MMLQSVDIHFGNGNFNCVQVSTLVIAEHEGGSVKQSSVSAVEAAKSLGKDNSISVLLAGSGPSLKDAAAYAASCHPSITKVIFFHYYCQIRHPLNYL